MATARELYETIKAEHAAHADLTFTIEPHQHLIKGCRCGSCLVCTGWMVTAGTECDDHPDAAQSGPGYCGEDLLTYEQAEYLIHAVANVATLLKIIGDDGDTQPWPAAQPMPPTQPGSHVQPWHMQAIAAYDDATGTVTTPNSNIPGMYTAMQANRAIAWWNDRAARL